ncbi:hypothetical protein [Neotabrizicola sp. sgz301269]|uniref:hypothetical protein n=1 Tax=Neotabrizicola sp. sgz301269 TaxID=3276282 RepID=UPI0037704B12
MQPKHFMQLIGQQAGETSRNAKYDPAHCDTVRLLAQGGEFPEAWCATIGVTPQTMRNWAAEHEEFREAIIQGRILLQTFWTRDIVENRTNPNAKPGLYSLIARRFRDLYGRDGGVDLTAWFLNEKQPTVATEAPAGAGAIHPPTMSDDALQRRLDELRRRDDINRESEA